METKHKVTARKKHERTGNWKHYSNKKKQPNYKKEQKELNYSLIGV